MKKALFIGIILLCAGGLLARYYCMPAQVVELGIDVLEEKNFDILEGKNVGLMTHQSGFNNMGISTIDVMNDADNFELVTLFTPAPGLRRDDNDGNDIDEKTGLPVVRLYGETVRPQEEELADIDVMVYDIQNVGTRHFTYKWNMIKAMEECAEYGVEFVVLDRPNPINGIDVQGAVADEEVTGEFVTYKPIPTRHGMTIGELAKLCNEHFEVGAELTVIKMQNWERWMFYDQTGLPWIPPSPNMRSIDAALFYPGIGICETTHMSVGRGLDIPFEIYGAPYIDHHHLAMIMNRISDKVGIRFIPWEFTPQAEGFTFEGEKCYGVRAIVLDRKEADPFLAGLYLVQHLAFLYPEDFYFEDGFKLLTGDKNAEAKIRRGMAPEDIIQSWKRGLKEFKEIREEYLLY